MPKIQRLLVVNRGEIAIRVCRAAEELGITTITLYAYEDRFALHRYKANESYQVGTRGQPLQAYLDIQGIITLALSKQVDAVHPGYGFLSESQEFAQKCEAHGIIFIGPRPEVLRALGDKVNGRMTAQEVGVPTLQGVKLTSGVLPESHGLDYPLMVKAAQGGGGRGMRVVHEPAELTQKVQEARQEALSAFGSDLLFLEAFLPNVRHIEVQILGDTHGNLVHLYERDCSLQRRHQKVIEYSPALRLDSQLRDQMCQDALKICREVAYTNAGTVEFLLDCNSGRHYFIEVNPRIQVEHTVTEVVTGLDIVKAQILVAEGQPLSHPMIGIQSQASVQVRSCALQCRVTTENPALNFMPDYGRITHYRSTGGCGVRLDAGTAFSGASVSPFYDPLLVKVTCSGNTFEVAINRMERALSEFCIHGVQTNLTFLLRLLSHSSFREGLCCTRFIDQNEAMFHEPAPRYAGDALCEFLANLAVNGNPLIPPNSKVHRELPVIPDWPHSADTPNLRATLRAQGPHQFCQDLLKSQSLWITDTTMRDAHQSLFATRMRTYDMLNIAEAYNQLPLFSMECWGGLPLMCLCGFSKSVLGSACEAYARSARTCYSKCCCEGVTRWVTRIIQTI